MNKTKADRLREQRYPIKPLDIIVIAVTVILTAVLLIVTLSKGKGSGVVISYDGKQTVVALSADCQMEFGSITVTVSGGSAWVSQSDCKNKICLQRGKISKVGETIVCAQYGLAVKVVGESKLAGSVGR